MSNTKSLMVAPQPDPVAVHINELIGSAKEWIDYAAWAVTNGADINEVFEALGNIGTSLLEIEKHNALTAAVVPGLKAALDTVTAQRDRLARNNAAVAATFNEQVKQAVDDTLECILGDGDCADDADNDYLANRMIDEGAEAVIEEERQKFERRMAEARQWAELWQAENPGTKPGYTSAATFVPAPDFKNDPYNLYGDDDDLQLTDGDKPVEALTDGN